MPRKKEPYCGEMCHVKPLTTFLLSMTLELFVVFVTGALFFFYDLEKDDTPWFVWTGTSLACIFIFWGLSYLTAPSFKKALGSYFKMDHVTPNLWTTCISYGYWMLYGKPFVVIKAFTIGLHVVLLWSLFSNLRVNILHQPWTLYTAGLYRYCRYGCIVMVVVFQVVGQAKGLANIAYFVTYLGLQNGLLSLVHFEAYLPTMAKRKADLEKQKVAAVELEEEFSKRESKGDKMKHPLSTPLMEG